MYTALSSVAGSPFQFSARQPVPGSTRQFDFDTLRRVPVTVSPEARALLDRGTHQTRVFPQALAEFYGELPDVTGISIALEEGEMALLAVTVQHTRYEDHLHRLSIEEMMQFHGRFRAAHMAEEMRRLTHEHYQRQEQQFQRSQERRT